MSNGTIINLLLNDLNEEQAIACTMKDNCVLLACPGSGKTRTIVYRLAWLYLSEPESQKFHIAITYTNRASEEVENRLGNIGVETDRIWTGTIHQFCMEFIIRPYSMYSQRLRYGYHIIDEYQKRKYIDEILKRRGIKNKFYDWQCDNDVLNEYRNILKYNNEIDFDDILDIGLKLIKENKFIAENISNIISSIQVDEYQDTNEIQYCIIAEICKQNHNIRVMFVGDVNQAIYNNLGGIAKTTKEIETLFEMPFAELSLHGCYRSTQRIIDIYSMYSVKKSKIISKTKYGDLHGIIAYNNLISKNEVGQQVATIIRHEISNGIPENEICVLAPQWNLLFGISRTLRQYLPDVHFDAPDITAFKYDPMNPFYLIASLLFTQPGHHERIRKKKASNILNILRTEYNITTKYEALNLLEVINRYRINDTTNDGVVLYKYTVRSIFELIGVKITNEIKLKSQYEAFLDCTEKRLQQYCLGHSVEDFTSFFQDKHGVVVTTLHSVKGEEYNTVIAFGLLNGFLPHWNYIFDDKGLGANRQNDTYRLLYVLLSRAKKNIYLISETGRHTKSGGQYSPTDELQKIKAYFDKWPF
jgi:DNA helicase-2/ATP-dependent DNA helicase PcrA